MKRAAADVHTDLPKQLLQPESQRQGGDVADARFRHTQPAVQLFHASQPSRGAIRHQTCQA